MPDLIFRYFPALSSRQKEQFSMLKDIYLKWNSMINVISRKDMDNFYVHHVLHSLSIAKAVDLNAGKRILDVGTGGGFPGIPLAVMFPDCHFTLLDSIAKKIKVVDSVITELELRNAVTLNKRAEDEKGKYDLIVSRAVTELPKFIKLTAKNISREKNNSPESGIIYLKGGDLDSELGPLRDKVQIWNIREFFSETYFETKKIVYIPFLTTNNTH